MNCELTGCRFGIKLGADAAGGRTDNCMGRYGGGAKAGRGGRTEKPRIEKKKVRKKRWRVTDYTSL